MRAPHPTSNKPRPSDPNLWPAIMAASVGGATLPVLLGVILLTGGATEKPSSMATPVSGQGQSFRAVSLGAVVFNDSCAACHAADGRGVPRLGKPLRNSAFVQQQDDEALFRLIADGRAIGDELNTTGALMPPRGARALTDAQVRDVVQYLRSMQDPSEPTASVDAWIVPVADPVAGAGGLATADLPGHAEFIASCSACHGADAKGLEGLGLPLAGSAFVNGLDDDALLTFVKSGRPVWDPESKTGVDMPPKGGNPSLDDAQIRTIIAYIRATNASPSGQ